MKDTRGLKLAEHQEFGKEVQRSAEFLSRSLEFLTARYGQSAYCHKKLAEVIRHLEEFRYEMDELAEAEHRGETKETIRSCYYQRPFEDAEAFKKRRGDYPLPGILD
ncbi:MAG: hypothetical protein RRB13_12065 [bacterium]|nr:hypothetical protein [bacterium]